jgi:hypothetical protein
MRSILLGLGLPIAIYACHRVPDAPPPQQQSVTNMQAAPRVRAATPQQTRVPTSSTGSSAAHDAGAMGLSDAAVIQTWGIRPDGEEFRVPAPAEGKDAGATDTPSTQRDLEARDGGSPVSPPDMIADGGRD